MIVKGPAGDFLDISNTFSQKSEPFLAITRLESVHFSLQVSRILILEKGGALEGWGGFQTSIWC